MPTAAAAPAGPASAGGARPAAPAAIPAAAPGAPGAAPPQAGAPRPFDEVVKDATLTPGFLPLWRKDDRTWIEIPAAQLDQPFFFSINMSRGIGERMLFGGLQGSWYAAGGEYVGQFRKAGGNIQLLARNTTYIARPGSPESRAVKNSFSDSLMGSAPIVSAPHPERKSVLIDATALLMTDMPRASFVIERAYRNNFAFDARNSFIESAKSDAERTLFDITAHYAQPRIPVPAPPPTMPGAPPAPFFPPPNVLEDPRSLFLGFLYNFSKLPEQPMRPRLADSRIGHFATPKVDFSDDSKFLPVRWYVQRWRMEKKDPSAAVSEPVQPITFWLGNEIPEVYREPIRQGILEWNKAFERVGFRNALVVKQQPDDADFDLGERRYSSIRWFATATPSFGAIGPSQVDPRTGEILDADIGWDASQVRNIRALKSEGVVSYAPMYDASTGELASAAHAASGGAGHSRWCNHFEHAAREMGFALSLLEARGELDPDSPAADKLVADFLKDVTMHEVGHTLGLRHNFHASTVATLAQLTDMGYAEKNGLTGSVMEYSPVNLSLRGEAQGAYFTPTLGAYDYWAIEYAYKPLPADQEGAELAKIAARSNEPQLAFATDEDIEFAIDPTVNQGDMGSDPLAFFRRRVRLSQELWQRLEQRQLVAGESYSVLRRRFLTGFGQLGYAMGTAAKYVGGSAIVNDRAGSSRLPVTPVDAGKQREAMTLIADALLKSDSFRVSPEFLRKLVTDRLERDSTFIGNFIAPGNHFELNLPERVLAMQRDVLNRLMGPVVARRVVENGGREAGQRGKVDSFTLGELYETVQRSIWEEARVGAESDVMRRNLQREHLRRMTAGLLASSAAFPADARALLRRDARQLREWLAAAAKKPGLSAETRAHYNEAADTLGEALKAQLMRAGA